MRLIKSKPQTAEQAENYNRYGLAILITGTLCFLVQLVQTVADFYSLYPPFNQKFIVSSPMYGNMAAVALALVIPAFIAFATHFLYGLGLSMFFNGKYKSPDTVLFIVVCIAGVAFAFGQYFVSTEGGKNAAVENFGYKANTRQESEADNIYSMELSTANSMFRSDSSVIADKYKGAIANAEARINSAKDSDKNWLRGNLSKIQMKMADEMSPGQNARLKAINGATERKNNGLKNIQTGNEKELLKQDADAQKYSTAGQWIAIILIPLFAFLKWLNSKFNHICGIEIQVVASEHDFEQSIWGKMWYAISDAATGQLNNVAVHLHDRFKPKELKRFNDPAHIGVIEFAANTIEGNTPSLVAASADADKKPSKIGFDVPNDISQNIRIQGGTVNVSSVKSCLHCGEALVNTKHWNRQYCDDECRNEGYTARTGKTTKIYKKLQREKEL